MSVAFGGAKGPPTTNVVEPGSVAGPRSPGLTPRNCWAVPVGIVLSPSIDTVPEEPSNWIANVTGVVVAKYGTALYATRITLATGVEIVMVPPVAELRSHHAPPNGYPVTAAAAVGENDVL